MKRIQHLLFLCLILFLASCSNVVFEHTIPEDQVALKKFPKELQGTYLDAENDTLNIFDTQYSYGELKGNKLLEGKLGNDLVLKQLDHYYFLNFKNENGYWEMIAARKTEDGITLKCVDVKNKDQIKNINKYISKGKAKSLKKDGKFLIKPENQELLEILNDTSLCDESHLIKIK